VRAQEPSTVIGIDNFEALAQKGSKIRLQQSQLRVPSQVPASRPQLGDIELDVELGGLAWSKSLCGRNATIVT
jgi:hypothetical protein